MARILLVFFRIIIIVVLIYYALKLLSKWLSSGFSKASIRTGDQDKGNKKRYKELTDQAIEDADYEEIESEDSK